MEEVTVDLILCIRALAALIASSPSQYSPLFSSFSPELYKQSPFGLRCRNFLVKERELTENNWYVTPR